MRKTLAAALVVSVGLGGQAYAQHEKEATVNFSLTHQFQKPVKVNGVESRLSWPAIEACNGTVSYKSVSKKITSQNIIKSISAAISWNQTTGKRNSALWTSSAVLVMSEYENVLIAPPYPNYPTWMPVPGDLPGGELGNLGSSQLWTEPWTTEGFAWPNDNSIRWNYIDLDPDCAPDAVNYEHHTRFWIKDPKNVSSLYQCFEVTPFFEIEEAYCYFCWDTIDRVTDGSITSGLSGGAICERGPSCGVKGSGTTKWYATIRFNNTVDNFNLLSWYRINYELLVNPTPAQVGADFSDLSLQFTVSGVMTYKWSYKQLGKDEAIVCIGTMSANLQGFGASPYCGVFTGSVSIPEKIILAEQCCQCSTGGGTAIVGLGN